MKIIFNKADELDGLHLLKLRDRVRATVEQQTVLRSVRDGHTMQILVDTAEDLTLEQALFREKAEFFEEVYSIRPVLKAKKLL